MTSLFIVVILIVVVTIGVLKYRKSKPAVKDSKTAEAVKTEKDKTPDVTYVCKICGERDCICNKENKSE